MSKQQQQQPAIVVVRHGERADKYQDFNGEPHNPSLTQVGFQQAIGVGKLLQQQYPGGQQKWHVVSSPFQRTIQTAIGIAGQLCCTTGIVDIDFGIAEHCNFAIPQGVVELTDEKACAIAEESSKRVSAASVLPARIVHGSAKDMDTTESLEAAGVRFMRAVHRIYDAHVQALAKNGEEVVNLLLVSHGFAPAQVMKQVHDVDVARVYLCSIMGLTLNPAFAAVPDSPFADLADKKFEEAVDDGASAAVAPHSPFLVGWSKGITDKKVAQEQHHASPEDKSWYEPHHTNPNPDQHYLGYMKDDK